MSGFVIFFYRCVDYFYAEKKMFLNGMCFFLWMLSVSLKEPYITNEENENVFVCVIKGYKIIV